jgi:hypothetical protein
VRTAARSPRRIGKESKDLLGKVSAQAAHPRSQRRRAAAQHLRRLVPRLAQPHVIRSGNGAQSTRSLAARAAVQRDTPAAPADSRAGCTSA